LIIAALVLLATAMAIAPRTQSWATSDISVSAVRAVVDERCVPCHSATPTHVGFPAAPAGVVLDDDEQVVTEAYRIYQQTFVSRAMPIGNLTRMTEDERSLINAWYQSLQEGP
jgi:uncharacterized membrane protein